MGRFVSALIKRTLVICPTFGCKEEEEDDSDACNPRSGGGTLPPAAAAPVSKAVENKRTTMLLDAFMVETINAQQFGFGSRASRGSARVFVRDPTVNRWAIFDGQRS